MRPVSANIDFAIPQPTRRWVTRVSAIVIVLLLLWLAAIVVLVVSCPLGSALSVAGVRVVLSLDNLSARNQVRPEFRHWCLSVVHGLW